MENEETPRKSRKQQNIQDLEPGTKILMGKTLRKIPWTRRKVEERFEMLTLIPSTTESVMWNGVRYDVFEGVECKLPRPHYDMYMERRKAEHKPKGAVIVIGGQAIGVQYAAGLEGFPDNPEREKLNLHSLAEERRGG